MLIPQTNDIFSRNMRKIYFQLCALCTVGASRESQQIRTAGFDWNEIVVHKLPKAQGRAVIGSKRSSPNLSRVGRGLRPDPFRVSKNRPASDSLGVKNLDPTRGRVYSRVSRIFPVFAYTFDIFPSASIYLDISIDRYHYRVVRVCFEAITMFVT